MSMRRIGDMQRDIGLSLSEKMRFGLDTAFVLCKSCERPFGHFSRTLPAFRLPLPLSASPLALPFSFSDGGVKGIRTNPQKIGLGRGRGGEGGEPSGGAAAAESPVFVIMAEPATGEGTIRWFSGRGL